MHGNRTAQIVLRTRRRCRPNNAGPEVDDCAEIGADDWHQLAFADRLDFM
jgi:hypothetical protein